MPACAAFGVKSSTSVTPRAPLAPPEPHPPMAMATATSGRSRRRTGENLRDRGADYTARRFGQTSEGGPMEAGAAGDTPGDVTTEAAAAATVDVIPARGPAAYFAEFAGTFGLV